MHVSELILSAVEQDNNLELEVDGVFGTYGGSVQRGGILVPMGSLETLVQKTFLCNWRQSYLINCLRSTNTQVVLNGENRVKYAPESVRRDRIGEIIKRHGMTGLPYDQYISSLSGIKRG